MQNGKIENEQDEAIFAPIVGKRDMFKPAGINRVRLGIF